MPVLVHPQQKRVRLHSLPRTLAASGLFAEAAARPTPCIDESLEVNCREVDKTAGTAVTFVLAAHHLW